MAAFFPGNVLFSCFQGLFEYFLWLRHWTRYLRTLSELGLLRGRPGEGRQTRGRQCQWQVGEYASRERGGEESQTWAKTRLPCSKNVSLEDFEQHVWSDQPSQELMTGRDGLGAVWRNEGIRNAWVRRRQVRSWLWGWRDLWGVEDRLGTRRRVWEAGRFSRGRWGQVGNEGLRGPSGWWGGEVGEILLFFFFPTFG